MKCGSLKKKVRSNCFNSQEELILLDDMSENDRYNAIIAHYKRQKSCEPNLLDGVTTLEDAIKVATAQDPVKKKNSHQFLISPKCLAEFCEILIFKIGSIGTVKSFKELHEIVKSSKIKGIGELCIYDTAERIGIFLNIFPDAVYLHRGTRDGAKKIIGRIKGNLLLKKDLPTPFQRNDLSYSELEDILCRYKNFF